MAAHPFLCLLRYHTTALTIRLDKDVVEWYRDQVEAAGGGNCQALRALGCHWHGPIRTNSCGRLYVERRRHSDYLGQAGHAPGETSLREKPMKKEYDFSNGKRGAIMSPPPGSVKVTLHLDKKLVEQVGKRLNAAGRGSYDMMINQAIREFLERAQETA